MSDFTNRAKQRLVEEFLAARRRREGRGQEASAAPARKAKATSNGLDSIPGFKQFHMQKNAAGVLDLDNPFFQVHDGRAGATSSIGGQEVLNFASYNYLGLNGHPEVNAAAIEAMERYGTSASASRLVAGERPVHAQLERAIADLHGVEDAVVMVSGHATNVTTIGHIMGQRDLILYDSWMHNSGVQGAVLAGARRIAFPHNDPQAVERLLAEQRKRYDRVLILLEGVYSMDGDLPDLAAFIDIKNRYDAILLVDEAHSLGVLGKTGRGIAEHCGIDPHDVDLWMGTLSKTLSGCGGYIASRSDFVEYLKYTAPGFVYSVGMPPPIAAAAHASIQVMLREPERVARLQARGHYFLETARAAGLDVGPSAGYSVVPVIVGNSVLAARLGHRLLERGINALPIVYPAVPEKSARLRFFLTCEHEEEQIRETVAVTAEELGALRAKGRNLREYALRMAMPEHQDS
ncbi:aminotransferase class I/II-fold pyridoxal phosphate-dependent enzyme [Aquibaculum arenosum]|uniref:Aminotransferase class I/II-fold pyridoxal phosphate-dependent enzyme n=1 Tax=Aquibaculum arenosum TaxID=3032591 RepID=A0ABT5YR22_9PROT|nr:aminotransferase class I/II-fold pyridoxal phosphate-dependent enzyme [Fodinicurvata sp. CAU 1616]MDF2097425.1 aminotransferase class I/II-fold pyridoxal phosphate-dependent enzyme [Fodinicurvata sp. CAU 1616]